MLNDPRSSRWPAVEQLVVQLAGGGGAARLELLAADRLRRRDRPVARIHQRDPMLSSLVSESIGTGAML